MEEKRKAQKAVNERFGFHALEVILPVEHFTWCIQSERAWWVQKYDDASLSLDQTCKAGKRYGLERSASFPREQVCLKLVVAVGRRWVSV